MNNDPDDEEFDSDNDSESVSSLRGVAPLRSWMDFVVRSPWKPFVHCSSDSVDRILSLATGRGTHRISFLGESSVSLCLQQLAEISERDRLSRQPNLLCFQQLDCFKQSYRLISSVHQRVSLVWLLFFVSCCNLGSD